MRKWILLLPLVLLALGACAPGAEPQSEESLIAATPVPTDPPLAEAATESPPTAVPTEAAPGEPTAIPTEAPPVEPTAVPTFEPTELPTEEPEVETAVVAGRIDDGAFFLGDLDAPVTMIDYSDFL